MSEPERTSNSEWPMWKCALFTGSICAIPLSLPILVYPVAGLSILAGLILLFVGLLKFFGTGFVVEGGCLVIILAVLLFTASPGLFIWLYGRTSEGRRTYLYILNIRMRGGALDLTYLGSPLVPAA